MFIYFIIKNKEQLYDILLRSKIQFYRTEKNIYVKTYFFVINYKKMVLITI